MINNFNIMNTIEYSMNSLRITVKEVATVQMKQQQRILRDCKGDTALIWAARKGTSSMVEECVERLGLPLNCQNLEGETALSVAIQENFVDMVVYLIERGADVNLPNQRAEYPIHLAVALGNLELVRILVKEGCWIEVEDECGDTPLHFAVREEQCEITEFLLSSGADSEHPNEDGETPAQLAKMVASENVQNYFLIYTNAATSEDSNAMVDDGDARGALVTSYDMKPHFPCEEKIFRMDVDEEDIDNDGRALGSSLGQSGSIPRLASHPYTKSKPSTLLVSNHNYYLVCGGKAFPHYDVN